MEYRVHADINYRWDSIRLAKQVYKGESPDLAERILQRYPYASRREIEPLYEGITAMLRRAGHTLKFGGERAGLLLTQRDEKGTAWADVFSISKDFYRRGITDPCRLVYLFFTLDNEDWKAVERPMPLEEFVSWLETTGFGPEAKYSLLRFTQEFEAYEAYMEGLVAGVSAFLQAELPVFRQRINETATRLERELAEKGLGFLEKLANVRLDEEAWPYDFYVSLVEPVSLSLFFQRELEIGRFHFGLSLFAFRQWVENDKNSEGRLHGVLKDLADPTKLNILRELRKKRRYSGELAELLGLSGATISHHMNSLVSDRLVNIEKQGNRVYYELDEKSIARHLNMLKRMLLE